MRMHRQPQAAARSRIPFSDAACGSRLRRTGFVLCMLCALPGAVTAQAREESATAVPVTLRPAALTVTSTAGRFAVEALGGAAGTALGFGTGIALSDDDCGEDLTCTLSNAANAVLLGTIGAAAGTYFAGRLAGTEPSGWGAIAGAVVGAVAAVGMDHLVSEELGANLGTAGHVVVFSLTQGAVTALGSRLGAALR